MSVDAVRGRNSNNNSLFQVAAECPDLWRQVTKLDKDNRIGRVEVYTGHGKGKTTAALGLALRATGDGKRVVFVQFLKGKRSCGEHLLVQRASKSCPLFDIICPNDRNFFKQPENERRALAAQTLALASRLVSGADYDVVVLDEVLTAVSVGLLTAADVLDLIKSKKPGLDLILTGRNAPPSIVDAADLVTQMLPIKHPFDKGIKARRGIEF